MDPNAVPLKEHFEKIFARQERDVRRALKLQAKEYERRLDTLNHAHERADEKAHDYVTNDKFETARTTDAQALKLALERQDGRLGSLERAWARIIGVGAVLVVMSGLIGGAIVKAFGG